MGTGGGGTSGWGTMIPSATNFWYISPIRFPNSLKLSGTMAPAAAKALFLEVAVSASAPAEAPA